ncbi:hypothetical protein ANN_08857 [Periplaneta americana]|uniref:PH domain-containing protein n=1 Tax=Periplaneta americana TaxID=6978 RepID=A0ABQ8T2K9_PERAM|nr:hypothetical protein ANN_08857 [Periplaneta americana]
MAQGGPDVIRKFDADRWIIIPKTLTEPGPALQTISPRGLEFQGLPRVKKKSWFVYLSTNQKVFHYGDCDDADKPILDCSSKVAVSNIRMLVTGKKCPHVRELRTPDGHTFLQCGPAALAKDDETDEEQDGTTPSRRKQEHTGLELHETAAADEVWKNRKSDQEVIDLAFSILLDEEPHTLDFVAPDQRAFDYWTDGMNCLLGMPKTSTNEQSVELVADALEEDHRVTCEELSEAMGFHQLQHSVF